MSNDIVDDATLHEIAIEAANCGARHALHNYSRRRNTLKTYDHDIKLELDVECQREIETLIHKHFPSHAIMGEEDATLHNTDRSKQHPANAGSEYEWIIDPIDGTVNFSSGLPMWCCSVAVRQTRDQSVVAGAVTAPMLEACYAAQREKPATRNDNIIHVSPTATLEESIVMTGMDRDLRPGVPPLACFSRIADNARKARIAGSAAVDLCWVAEGAADGYFEGSIFLWDVAAAGLIAKQSGATVEKIWDGSKLNQLGVIASNGLIHAQLRMTILDVGFEPQDHS